MPERTPDSTVTPDTAGFRLRARTLRAAARSSLRDLRAERRARSRGAQRDDVGSPSDEADGASPDMTPADADARQGIASPRTEAVHAPARPDMAADPFADLPRLAAGAAPAHRGRVSEVAEGSDDLSVMTVSSAASAVARHAMHQTVQATHETARPVAPTTPRPDRDAPEVGARTSRDETPDRPDDFAASSTEDCDLLQLPGAGPGLVWMLREAGVQGLHDLARADADDLATRLGLVGRLIDLGAWIRHARQATAMARAG